MDLDKDDAEDDDGNNGPFRKHYTFAEYEDGIAGFGIFYLNKYGQKSIISNGKRYEPMLLAIGGIIWNTSSFSDKLWRWNGWAKYRKKTKTERNDQNKRLKKWSEITSASLTNQGMSRFGYTTTKNQQYIILLGGFCDFEEIDDIYFIDTTTWKFRESLIKCPKESKDFCAITMVNETNDELIIFGYVRWLYYGSEDKHKFQSILFPPVYILKFISNWYYNEWIHLIEFNQDPLLQWKIHTDTILNNFVDDIQDDKSEPNQKNEEEKDDEANSEENEQENDDENRGSLNDWRITPL